MCSYIRMIAAPDMRRRVYMESHNLVHMQADPERHNMSLPTSHPVSSPSSYKLIHRRTQPPPLARISSLSKTSFLNLIKNTVFPGHSGPAVFFPSAAAAPAAASS